MIKVLSILAGVGINIALTDVMVRNMGGIFEPQTRITIATQFGLTIASFAVGHAWRRK